MIIETASNDLLALAFRLRDGNEDRGLKKAVNTDTGSVTYECLRFTCRFSVNDNDSDPHRDYLYVTETDKDAAGTDEVGRLVDAVPLDALRVIPGAYPFSVELVTYSGTADSDKADDEIVGKQTIAYADENVIRVHSEV